MKIGVFVFIFIALIIVLLYCLSVINFANKTKDDFLCPNALEQKEIDSRTGNSVNEQDKNVEEEYPDDENGFGTCTDFNLNGQIYNLKKTIESNKDEILKTSTNCPLSFSCNKLATDLRNCINEENITNCPDKYDEEDIRCTYDEYTSNISNQGVLLPVEDNNNNELKESLEYKLLKNARLNTDLNYTCDEYNQEKKNINDVVKKCRDKFIKNDTSKECVSKLVTPSSTECNDGNSKRQLQFLNMVLDRNLDTLHDLQCGCSRCENLNGGRNNSACFSLCPARNSQSNSSSSSGSSSSSSSGSSSSSSSSSGSGSGSSSSSGSGSGSTTRTTTSSQQNTLDNSLSGSYQEIGTNPRMVNDGTRNNVESRGSKFLTAPNLGYEISEDEMKSMYGNRPGEVSGSLSYSDIRTADNPSMYLENTNNKETTDSIFGNLGDGGLYGDGYGDNKQKYYYTKGDSYSRGPSIKQDNIKGVSNVFSPHIIVNPPIFDMNTGLNMHGDDFLYN